MKVNLLQMGNSLRSKRKGAKIVPNWVERARRKRTGIVMGANVDRHRNPALAGQCFRELEAAKVSNEDLVSQSCLSRTML